MACVGLIAKGHFSQAGQAVGYPLEAWLPMVQSDAALLLPLLCFRIHGALPSGRDEADGQDL